jgi:hypothetical protein
VPCHHPMFVTPHVTYFGVTHHHHPPYPCDFFFMLAHPPYPPTCPPVITANLFTLGHQRCPSSCTCFVLRFAQYSQALRYFSTCTLPKPFHNHCPSSQSHHLEITIASGFTTCDSPSGTCIAWFRGHSLYFSCKNCK